MRLTEPAEHVADHRAQLAGRARGLGLRPQLFRHRVPVDAVHRLVEMRVANDPPRRVERLDTLRRLRAGARRGCRGHHQRERQDRKHPSARAAGDVDHFNKALMPGGRSKTDGGTLSYSIELIVIT